MNGYKKNSMINNYNIMQLAENENEIENELEEEFTTSKLNYIRDTIEMMNKFHQIEVLRILKNSEGVILNENKNGIYVNLTELDNSVLKDLSDYIMYTNNQENYLSNTEKEKEMYKEKYFTKDNKDKM